MTIKIDHSLAKQVLFSEYQNSIDNVVDPTFFEWKRRIEKLSELCPYRKSSTFIAAIGTALLAKSVEPGVDVYCLLDRDGHENSYSARSLADNVWAKNRALLGVDLGANGANPLNNTPFIGKSRIDQISNVRNKEGYEFLVECLDLLATYKTTEEAKSALRGFIAARRKGFKAIFSVGEDAGDYFVVPSILKAIKSLLEMGSEEGRCAQAVAAGLLAVAFGKDFIDVGHINDPDRNFPLDIVVLSQEEKEQKIIFSVEVKDKPIGAAEILSSVEKSLKLGVYDVVFLAVSRLQVKEDFVEVYERARDLGCKLIIYYDWEQLIKACLMFSKDRGANSLSIAYKLIGEYLTVLGASKNAVAFWEGLGYLQNRT